ncbi:MAG: transposase [Deltaproteobacteria bacterium]|nr:transposase [Deltaproteobacteria bacterium]
MRRKLHAPHYAARHSFGIEAGAQSVASELPFLVEKLQLIKRQIFRIDGTLLRLADETEEGKYLLSIRGLNYISVAELLAELGSFRSYRSAKQLIKMAGSNPTESESAGKRGSHSPMSKMASGATLLCMDCCYPYAAIES